MSAVPAFESTSFWTSLEMISHFRRMAPENSAFRVVLRIRPPTNGESRGSIVGWETSPRTISIDVDSETKSYTFHHVFGTSASQAVVYDETVSDLVRTDLFNGINVTVMTCTFYSLTTH